MDDFNDPFIALKLSQESLEFALQSGKMGTWDINLVNNTVQCSREMLELWGLSPEEFDQERSILQMKVHPEDLQIMRDAIDKAIKEESIYELEYRIIPKDGDLRWVLSRGRCRYHPHSNIPQRFSGIVYDITDKKLKQEILEKAIKARDQFFMIAGHELRTPLTCLELQLQVMEWDLKDQGIYSREKLEQGLKKQRDHLARITRIVENILDDSKITRGELPMILETFDLSEMVATTVDEFRIAAVNAGVEVKIVEMTSAKGKWDKFKLEQVLLNLLTNALRYGEKKPILISVTRDHDEASFSVKDFGCGIHSKDQKRVFERFERVSGESTSNGMGLGLFISRGIVRAHGGEISLESAEGQGSCFTVTLPLSSDF